MTLEGFCGVFLLACFWVARCLLKVTAGRRADGRSPRSSAELAGAHLARRRSPGRSPPPPARAALLPVLSEGPGATVIAPG